MCICSKHLAGSWIKSIPTVTEQQMFCPAGFHSAVSQIANTPVRPTIATRFMLSQQSFVQELLLDRNLLSVNGCSWCFPLTHVFLKREVFACLCTAGSYQLLKHDPPQHLGQLCMCTCVPPLFVQNQERHNFCINHNE